MSKQTIFCVLFVCAFVFVSIASAAPQSEGGVFGKLKQLYDKLSGDGVKASCSAIPSMFDSIVPGCLECNEGIWKIKSGLGLLKCRKSRKAVKNGAGIVTAGSTTIGTTAALAAIVLLLAQ